MRQLQALGGVARAHPLLQLIPTVVGGLQIVGPIFYIYDSLQLNLYRGFHHTIVDGNVINIMSLFKRMYIHSNWEQAYSEGFILSLLFSR